MAQRQAIVALRVFLSSPGGLQPERAIVLQEINRLSRAADRRGEPILNAIRWPDEVGSGVGDYNQAVINWQTSGIDILVCIVGARMGTPTPRANSGTEEEFDRAMEARLAGAPVQILLFFNNAPVRPQEIDPYQLMLVRAFREKAGRLGVLYHTCDDAEQLRSRVRVSLAAAHNHLCRADSGTETLASVVPSERARSLTIQLGDIALETRVSGPQWADAFPIPLAEYRHRDCRITGLLQTNSPYFRFGFKYYDSRELLFSAGSIQTAGANVVLHTGRNKQGGDWFVTSYKGGYRTGEDRPLRGTSGLTEAPFEIHIGTGGSISFRI